jgi:RecA/RadA recombinase
LYGKSDCGKTSLIFHTAIQAQKNGILPVLIVTEGKVDWGRATAMGFDKDNAIVEENLKYLEEVFEFIDNKIINNVMNGTIPHDVIILWDSMGNTISEKSVEVDKKTGERKIKNTHMQAAAIKSERLSVLMDRVNDTRKINYPKSVGIMIVNSVYTGQAAYSGAIPPEIIKGGNKVKYTATLMLKMQLINKLEAIKDGNKLKFGLISRLSVTKNHLNGQEFSGEFVITPTKFLANDTKQIKDYKDEFKDTWGDMELFESEVEMED